MPSSSHPIEGIVTKDTGLGTTFERWALNRFLLRLHREEGLESVLEGPEDGMTGISGINSLILALSGVDVTLILSNPGRADLARQVWSHYLRGNDVGWNIRRSESLPDEGPRFDLVWNFNVMTRQERPAELLEKMCRLSRRFVLIFVPNRLNYSYPLHRLHHLVARQPWDHGDISLMRPNAWRRTFDNLGFHRRKTIWIDCPWWPDIVDFGQLIKDFIPFLKGLSRRAEPQNRYAWRWEDLPYYESKRYPEIRRRMERLAYFENSRLTWLKKRFAHHLGILAERDI